MAPGEQFVIVVTGASDGIGRAAALAFAENGARVVMIGRNEAKTAAAARAIMSATGSRTVEWLIADLSRQDAVRELAAAIWARCPRIDVLVNNAGAVFSEREQTIDGIERTFALNHLAYVALALLLLPSLTAAALPGKPARIINVASRAHRDARLSLDDLQLVERYKPWRAYANSKLANILFTRALAQRLEPSTIVVHALHPGVVSTRFATNNGRRGRLARRVMDVVAISPEQGADTVVWLAREDAAARSTGGYWVKRAELAPSPRALDVGVADALWTASLEMLQLDGNKMIADSGAARETPVDSRVSTR